MNTEVLSALVKTMQDKWTQLTSEIMPTSQKYHNATPTKARKLRGPGYTRRLHEESKTRRKMAARSQRINRKG